MRPGQDLEQKERPLMGGLRVKKTSKRRALRVLATRKKSICNTDRHERFLICRSFGMADV